jgi:hypothetical protein
MHNKHHKAHSTVYSSPFHRPPIIRAILSHRHPPSPLNNPSPFPLPTTKPFPPPTPPLHSAILPLSPSTLHPQTNKIRPTDSTSTPLHTKPQLPPAHHHTPLPPSKHQLPSIHIPTPSPSYLPHRTFCANIHLQPRKCALTDLTSHVIGVLLDPCAFRLLRLMKWLDGLGAMGSYCVSDFDLIRGAEYG